MKKIFTLSVIIFVSIFLIGTFSVTAGGKPFKKLQKQINEINEKLDLLLDQYCPEGEFVAAIDTDGYIICVGADPAADIVAYGQGLENHLARSRLKITPENLPQASYIMGCQKSDGSVGPVGTDPFAASHANYLLEFGPGLAGATLDAIAVEIFDPGSSSAYIELIDTENNNVLETSNSVSTSTAGWIEFVFSPGFIIDANQILVNFVTTDTDARAHNCANTVEFIPQ